MHDARSVFGRHEAVFEYDETARLICIIRKEWFVPQTHEIGPIHAAHESIFLAQLPIFLRAIGQELGQCLVVRGQSRFGKDQVIGGLEIFDNDVDDLRPYTQREVLGQGPGCRRPRREVERGLVFQILDDRFLSFDDA